jgi:hypothetical protein
MCVIKLNEDGKMQVHRTESLLSWLDDDGTLLPPYICLLCKEEYRYLTIEPDWHSICDNCFSFLFNLPKLQLK